MTTKSEPHELGALESRRSDATFRQIMALIYDGRLAPGERLPAERQLAQQLHVSRPTLRDALNRLEARGFVDRRTGSGSYVCTSLPESVRGPIEDGIREKLVTLRQIIEVRKPLEVWAVQEAANRRTRKELAELKRMVTTMRKFAQSKKVSGEEAYFGADVQFHLGVARMTGNPVYLHLIHFLTDLIRKSLVISQEILDEDFRRANDDRHEAIYEGIAAGNSKSAAKAMAEHFAFVESKLPS